MKAIVALPLFGLCVCCLPPAGVFAADNWRLGMQAYTFNRFTFYEAVEKTKTLGLKYIEAYPGQPLSKETPDVRFDHNLSPELRQQIRLHVQESGVKLVNYGVVALPNDEEECRKVFDFARDMSIETIVSEPPEDAFELVDRLCEEYNINVAIHNHPKPSHYWDPNTVLKVCQGRSPRIGACADTGHWTRSGVDPVEAIKKLKGRIIGLHFKDLNEFGKKEAHDVVWGTGVSKADAVLAELAQQGFKGVFSIEYEYNWLDSMPEIAQCIAYFNTTASRLGQSDQQRLFDDENLNAWIVKGDRAQSKWVVGIAKVSSQDPKLLTAGPGTGEMVNVVSKHGEGLDIYSKAKFGDCRIELEVMVPQGSNSGIYVMGEYEIQVLDSYGRTKLDNSDMGAVYGAAPPPVNACKKPGEWQQYVIEFNAPKFDAAGNKTENAKFLKIQLNGRILHENLEMKGPTPGGIAGKESPVGPLMFQGNHGPVAYRNILVTPLVK